MATTAIRGRLPASIRPPGRVRRCRSRTPRSMRATHARTARRRGPTCKGSEVLLPERQRHLVRLHESAVAGYGPLQTQTCTDPAPVTRQQTCQGVRPDVRRRHRTDLRRHHTADLQRRTAQTCDNIDRPNVQRRDSRKPVRQMPQTRNSRRADCRHAPQTCDGAYSRPATDHLAELRWRDRRNPAAPSRHKPAMERQASSATTSFRSRATTCRARRAIRSAKLATCRIPPRVRSSGISRNVRAPARNARRVRLVPDCPPGVCSLSGGQCQSQCRMPRGQAVQREPQCLQHQRGLRAVARHLLDQRQCLPYDGRMSQSGPVQHRRQFVPIQRRLSAAPGKLQHGSQRMQQRGGLHLGGPLHEFGRSMHERRKLSGHAGTLLGRAHGVHDRRGLYERRALLARSATYARPVTTVRHSQDNARHFGTVPRRYPMPERRPLHGDERGMHQRYQLPHPTGCMQPGRTRMYASL